MNRTRRMLVLLAVWPALLVAANSNADDRAPRERDRTPRLLAVFIGGMDSDPTPDQVAGVARRNEGNSGLYQLCHDLHGDRVQGEYFNWNGTRAGEIKSTQPPRSQGIADFIYDHVQHRPHDNVAIVGNSWGGHTALEVMQQLTRRESPVAVQLTIFLDASSTGREAGPPKALPENTNRFVHFHTRNLFVWSTLPRDKRLETIDLGDPDAGFMRDGRPAYNAPFNFEAHVAAEWDERIHAEIERRLLELVESQ
ncbi:MAG: hypothetical protein EXS05_24200 [Planctomycetaceae bacterium]|nr:hypothetical protein [Planctomycetaceae bacterium]